MNHRRRIHLPKSACYFITFVPQSHRTSILKIYLVFVLSKYRTKIKLHIVSDNIFGSQLSCAKWNKNGKKTEFVS